MEVNKIKTLVDGLFSQFHNIGENPEGKGVTRLGYEKEEDEMHEKFIEIGKSYGFDVEIDSVGNSILSNVSAGEKYFMMGSHLDSVIEGGRYDGVVGVLTGLALMIISKEENLNIPMKVIAFRCEENNSFSLPTVGSRLFIGTDSIEKIKNAKSTTGKTLGEIFKARGYTGELYDIKNIINYIEVHIEQARILENKDLSVGIVTGIAGIYSQRIEIKGLSEHSGATPMDIRKDTLCGASEIILAIERLGNKYEEFGCRATVGVVNNNPNALNVVPGSTNISMDVRGIIKEKMRDLYDEIMEEIEIITKRRNLAYEVHKFPWIDPVMMEEEIINDFEKSCNNLGIPTMKLHSGAGHDAMNLAHKIDIGMLFIPNKDGVSHNPDEDIDTNDLVKAIEVLIEYYKNFKF